MKKLFRWLFRLQKKQLYVPITTTNSAHCKHIWKAYNMPNYVRCAKCGKKWTKNEQTDNID
jgi:hypothetical protein